MVLIMIVFRRRGAVSLALALPLALVLAGCQQHPAPAPSQPPRSVRVAMIEARPLIAPMAASGLLVSREEAAVTSELAGFRVATVLVDQGAWVKAGQPMALLDDTLLRSQIAIQQVAADRAAKRASAVADLDGKAVLSQEDIDSRRFDARSAQAALDDLKVRQSRLILRAPVSGLVLERTVRPGDLSGGGSAPMFRLARDGQIEVAAEVPEDLLRRLRPGQLATITLPDGGQTTGQVRLISPEVDPQTKLGVARVSLPVASNLRPGGFARAVFPGVGQPALVAPAKAVNYDADGTYVMTLDARNRVHRVAVRIGVRAGGVVELVQGPSAGVRVLMSGATTVLEGDLVAAVEAAPTGAAQ
jgi:HlyD family secretion protein